MQNNLVCDPIFTHSIKFDLRRVIIVVRENISLVNFGGATAGNTSQTIPGQGHQVIRLTQKTRK